MTGKMHAMFPVVRMRQMLFKYKNELYSGMYEYMIDERWLLDYFLLNPEPGNTNHHIIDIMEESADVEEMSEKILAFYLGITVPYKLKNHLIVRQKVYATIGFYNELASYQQSDEFRAGYCAGVLKELKMINTMEDPYWLDENSWMDRLKGIGAFYALIIHWDREFVR